MVEDVRARPMQRTSGACGSTSHRAAAAVLAEHGAAATSASSGRSER